MSGDRRAQAVLLIPAAAGLALSLWGCASPLERQREQDLRRAVVDTIRTELSDAEQRPDPRVTQREYDPLPIDERFLPELENMAGPASRNFETVDYGPDLMGLEARTVGLSLERAIRSAVRNNLEVQFAQLAPAISEADVIAAEAAFDWVLFSNFEWNEMDQVRPSTSFGISSGFDQRQTVENTTGIRRALESGGQFAIQNELLYSDFETTGLNYTPDPATQAAIALRFDQPLLRNFGSDVALAQVRLNRNAERDAVARLRVQLLAAVNQTEQTYWQLVRAHHELAILQRHLERGLVTRGQLQARLEAGLDVPPSQLADAVARVERRKSDITQARVVVRDTSDRLKVLMNDADFPVGSEALLAPLDVPVDEPLTYNLLDALTTAVQHRPEVDQAILSIDNTSIRQTVAANQRLPQLDLQVQTRFQGLDEDTSAYDEVFDGNFVDYLVGLVFEQPIGNRAAEAQYVRRRLEREQAIISYKNTVQQIVRDVKSSLRAVVQNYQIIIQTRQSRIAATESLRTLQIENEQIRERSSERLELEFNRQDALANAERAEMEAITNFNSSVAQLYAAMGTALERSRIDLAVPTAEEALPGRHSRDWYRRPARTDAAEQIGAGPQDAPGAQPEPTGAPDGAGQGEGSSSGG
ncbi:MAG TPA: TolC family protein [Phycisphaerales bacterium]|nr:TolC family protein [Phycisphaerales bacterium]